MKAKKNTDIDEANVVGAEDGIEEGCPINEALHRRLNKVIGQCNGILRMIDRKSQCEDILLQVSAAKNALHRVGQLVLEDYLRQCIEEGVKAGDVDATTRRYARAIEYFCRQSK